ncbi:MAG: hypothetical protein C0459_01170 [Chitinophaga sp.]|jgi:TonB dependent receptor/CarboxypepD_reg-like domain/TonB-dependent Receptor Plug Domain|nr:hypothetical protein [Chitinophaga sp.]
MSKLFFYKLLLVLFFFCIQSSLFAQNKWVINGVVKDKKTGELLIGAAVKIEGANNGTISNSYGFYSLTVKEGKYNLIVSFQGFQLYTQAISITANMQLDIFLTPQATTLTEVTVTTKKKNDNITKPQMGVEKLNINEINQLPVLFGERDILKSIQLLPGIKSAGEGNSGFYVRGGSSDQNLILLDEAPVYNAAHLLGFFSTFNSDAIKDVSVYKGTMPAQYGGRLSSVEDVKMKDGNNKDYDVSGGVGLIASRLNIEGPIVKDKGSFIVSGRRTYADAFLKFSKDTTIKSNKLYFYDLNAKANYILGKKDRLFLSGYFGRDVLGFGQTFNTDWGNSTATLRWNHVVNNRLFSNTSVIYSKFEYNINIKSGQDNIHIDSQIEDFNLKQDFDLFINNANKLKFGANVIHHEVSPGKISSDNPGFKSNFTQNKSSWESAAYISHELAATDKLNIVYGLRLTNLSVWGPGSFYKYDSAGNTTDTLKYAAGQLVASYWNVEPRVSASYQLNEVTSFKASYTRNIQNLHLISNSTSGSPTDLWLSSSNNLKPEIADQISAGFFKNFKNNMYEFSAEAYYKWMQNQIDYRSGAQLRGDDNVESQLLLNGVGRAYGLELLVRKKAGKLTGWIGYTISRTEKRFDGIDNGKWFAARQDRTHDLAIVAIYKLNAQWSLSSNFIYYTGSAVTFPSGKYRVNNATVFLYTERNGYRMPAYHRLDLAATYDNKKNKNRKYQSSWTFGIYNLYGRDNAYSIEFKDDPNNPTKTIAEQTTLFRFVPSITWNFKF